MEDNTDELRERLVHDYEIAVAKLWFVFGAVRGFNDKYPDKKIDYEKIDEKITKFCESIVKSAAGFDEMD